MRLWAAVCVWCMLAGGGTMCEALQITFSGYLQTTSWIDPEVPLADGDLWDLHLSGTLFEPNPIPFQSGNGRAYRLRLTDVTGRTYGNERGWLEFPYMDKPHYSTRPEWRGTIAFQVTAGMTPPPRGELVCQDCSVWYYWHSNGFSGGNIITVIRDSIGREKTPPWDGPFLWYGPSPWATAVRIGPLDSIWRNPPTLYDIPSGSADYRYGAMGGWIVDEITIVHDDLMYGDAEADGDFDRLDIVQVLSAGKYLTGQRAAWSQGDWTADGLFDQQDIVAALPNYGLRVPQMPQAAVRAVPEPSAIELVLSFAVGVLISYWVISIARRR